MYNLSSKIAVSRVALVIFFINSVVLGTAPAVWAKSVGEPKQIKTQIQKQPQDMDLRGAVASLKSDQGWESIIDADGIKGFRKKEEGSEIYAIKGYAELEGNLETTATALVEPTHTRHWVSDLTTTKVVSGSFPIDAVVYNLFATPFIVHDREFLSHAQMQVDTKNKILLFTYTPSDFDYPPNPPNVRGEVTRSLVAVMPGQDDHHTLVYTEFHADPKGNIPSWVINRFQKTWPRRTMKALRDYLKNTEITVLPAIQNALSLAPAQAKNETLSSKI